jgi:hypothetical protein
MNQLNCDVCGPTPALDRKVPLLTAAQCVFDIPFISLFSFSPSKLHLGTMMLEVGKKRFLMWLWLLFKLILINFQVKNTLKSNRNHTLKQNYQTFYRYFLLHINFNHNLYQNVSKSN